MEKTIEDLMARKNYLVATNARLAMSLMGAPMPTPEDSNVKMNKSPLKKEAGTILFLLLLWIVSFVKYCWYYH